MRDAEDNNLSGGLSRLELRRALRIWLLEGPIATVYITLTTGTFQTGFAIALGCTNFEIGLLAGIASIVGLLQLTAPALMRHFPSRRHFVSTIAFASRAFWLPMLLIPFVIPHPAWAPALLVLTLLSSALGATTGATWVDWMSDLVPLENRGRYFGVRNLWCGITGMAASVAGGIFFDHAVHRLHWTVIMASAILFAFALFFAFGSFLCGRASPDVAPKTNDDERSLLQLLRTPFKDPKFRGVLNFSLANIACQAIAGQFFIVYMIEKLRLTYGAIQLLNAVASVVSFVSMPVLGYLADKYGNKPILILCCVFCVFAPFLWCLTVRDPYPGLWSLQAGHILISNSKLIIILLNILSGVGWAGVGITQFNIIINCAPAQDRTSYIGANSTLVGLVGGICPLIGGALLTLFRPLPYPHTGIIRGEFHLLFLIAGLMRFLMIAYAARLDEPDSRSTRYVLGQLRAARPVGSFTAIHRLGRSGDSRTRARAAEQLGRLKTPVAVEELVKALDDVSLPVREQAAASLGEIGDARAVRPLVSKLTDLASGIAPEAAVALGKIGDRAALPSLAAAIQLGGPLPRRLAAIEALGRMPDRRVPEVLAPLVSERDPSVRIAALRALAGLPDAIGSDQVVDVLLAQWRVEEEPTVLPALAEALAVTGRAELAPRLFDAYDQVASPLVEREILNAVGSLLGGQDSFYAYLVLDGVARDETARKILSNLQKTYRKSGGAGHTRAAVRLRQAQDDYLAGQYGATAGHIYQAALLLSAEKDDAVCPPALKVLEAINARAERTDALSAEEALLAIFILRLYSGAR